jgi:hypothetical protein
VVETDSEVVAAAKVVVVVKKMHRIYSPRGKGRLDSMHFMCIVCRQGSFIARLMCGDNESGL